MNALITPHAVYRGLGQTDEERRNTYRKRFRASLDEEAIADIRLALNQISRWAMRVFWP